jgi:pyrrolidone-carboxylate peptidase
MYPKPDIILHIGLAAGRKFFALEKGAHGRGYGMIPDVDGERFSDEAAEEQFPKASFPPKLHTSFDTADVLDRWRSQLGYKTHGDILASLRDNNKAAVPDVRLSPDAGNYMCGFIYWNSLAHYFSIKEDERPVVFLHVPDLTDSDEKLEQGRQVAIALIKALVESRRKRGVVDGLERVARGENSQEYEKAGVDVNFA